jgi:DNA replication protein DnaC
MIDDLAPVQTSRQCAECNSEFAVTVLAGFPNWGPRFCPPCQLIQENRLKTERDAEDLRNRFRASGIEQQYCQYDQERDRFSLLPWILERQDKSLCISGQYQLGKTHCVAHAGYKMLVAGVGVRFVRCGEWMRNVAAMMGRDMEEAELMISRAKRADLLILDDLGKEKLTDRGGEVLFGLIDERERRGKSTWITTNHDGNGLEEKLGFDRGPAIVARLRRGYHVWRKGPAMVAA